MDEIDDIEFDQYLDGNSALSRAYKEAASYVESPAYVDKLIIGEARAVTEIKQLDTPEIGRLDTPIRNERSFSLLEWLSGRWVGPAAGAVCAAVLAVGLTAKFLDSDGTMTPDSTAEIAESPSPMTPQSETVGAAADAVGLAREDAQAITASTESLQPGAVSKESLTQVAQSAENTSPTTQPPVEAEQPIAVTEHNDTEAMTSIGMTPLDAIVTVEAVNPNLDAEAPRAREEASFVESDADNTNLDASGDAPTPSVMAPADAMVEADGPRVPPLSNDDALLEQAQPSTAVVLPNTGDSTLTPEQEESVGEIMIAANDPALLSDDDLAKELAQTEERAELLEDSNSELRKRLRALEKKIFESTSGDATADRSVDQTAVQSTTAAAAQEQDQGTDALLLAMLEATPSDFAEGREMVLLSIEDIRELLASTSETERYRPALLALIGAANRSEDSARTRSLVEIYGQVFPNSPKIPATVVRY